MTSQFHSKFKLEAAFNLVHPLPVAAGSANRVIGLTDIRDCLARIAELEAENAALRIEIDRRDRAYLLWEQAGSPDGMSTEFWHQA